MRKKKVKIHNKCSSFVFALTILEHFHMCFPLQKCDPLFVCPSICFVEKCAGMEMMLAAWASTEILCYKYVAVLSFFYLCFLSLLVAPYLRDSVVHSSRPFKQLFIGVFENDSYLHRKTCRVNRDHSTQRSSVLPF